MSKYTFKMIDENLYPNYHLEKLKFAKIFWQKPRQFFKIPCKMPPYEGAKPSFLIEEKIVDSDWLSELISISLKELPTPKPKQGKKK